ncbi:MAG: DUF2066 domain-containing protein [Alphaproteobacteria bacterium]
MVVFASITNSYAGEEAYIVKGVTITLPMGDPATLREQALVKATEEGYAQLLKKLTPSSAWPRHAWLMQSLPASKALERFAIVSEETDGDYVLTANVTFDRAAVRKLLSNQGIPFHETEQSTVLLIPLYEAGSAKVLWEDVNPWRDALRNALLQQGAVVFTLPAGDVNEMALVTADMAANLSRGALLALAKNYNASAVVVAKIAMQPSQMTVQADWVQPEGQSTPPATTFSLPLPADAALDFAQPASQLFTALEGNWQQNGTVAADKPGTASISLSADSVEDVAAFVQALRTLTAVQKVTPRLISRAESRYRVDYYGDFSAIQSQLGSLGYPLQPQENGWQVVHQSPAAMPE